MGMFSSWPALAVTNHVLTRLAGKLCGYNNFSDYFVLGDDLVIFNEEVSLKYIELSGSIGIDSKADDSIVPKPDHTLEIAKRLFRNGVEISPVPIRLMQKSLGLFTMICVDRGLSSQLGALNPRINENIYPMTAAILYYY